MKSLFMLPFGGAIITAVLKLAGYYSGSWAGIAVPFVFFLLVSLLRGVFLSIGVLCSIGIGWLWYTGRLELVVQSITQQGGVGL